MNILQQVPDKVRVALYLVYALAGPVLIYLIDKRIAGADEMKLYLGVGSVFGLTAAANVAVRQKRGQ